VKSAFVEAVLLELTIRTIAETASATTAMEPRAKWRLPNMSGS
jgi:hypothetical protein